MNIERVRNQLMTDEGVKYEIYLDHLGYPTFGIGHLVKDSDPEHGKPVGTPVSKDRVNEAFEADLKVAVKGCHNVYEQKDFERFPEEVQEILVNMLFNLGETRLRKFQNFKRALEAGDWKTAAAEGRNSLWYKQVTNRAERLMSRLEKVQ